MRIIRNLLLIVLVVGGGYYLLEHTDILPVETGENFSKISEPKESKLKKKEAPEENLLAGNEESDIFRWIGVSADEVVEKLGEPVRKDLSAYGYTWWVYTDQEKQYIQFGIIDDTIVTVFAAGDEAGAETVHTGDSYAEVNDELSFAKDVSFQQGVSSYTFHLSDEDLQMRPLAQLSDDLFVQYYFDTFTDELSSIRVLTADTLLKHRPYEVEYRGDLPESPDLPDNKWEKVESGMEQQIFDLTNVFRSQHEKAQVEWGEQVKAVAFLHSKDMADNNYFSHYSLNGNGLKERLAEEDIHYLAAGENIAAQYTDAPAAMQGWLNSEGHREALFNEDYTHLGVGVYRFYYTQNFLSKQ